MDGGLLEKQKAEEIKIEVNKHRKRGRRKGQASRDSISEENPLTIQTDIDANHESLWDGSGEEPRTPASALEEESLSDTRRDSHHTPVDGEADQSRITTLDSNEIFITSPEATGFRSDLSSPSSFEQILASAPDLEPPASFPTWEQLVGNGTSFFLTPRPEESYTFDFWPAPLPTASPLQRFNNLLEPELVGETIPQAVLSNDSPSLYHVLDHILPNMLPSLSPTARNMLRKRALLPRPSGPSIVPASIVALSYFFRKLGLERISGSSNSELDAAIRENTSYARRLLVAALQHTNGDDQDLPDISLSLLLVLLLHVEQGLLDHDNVTSLLQSIVARRKSPLTADNDLTRMVCGFAVAHDVLWSASSRRRPLLTADAASIAKLNAQDLDMPQTTGCECWIFQRIADITLLRIWKRECLTSQALNIAELARRATKLEQQIDSHARESMENSGQNSIEKPCSSVTKVYEAATKIYLHVVLSGASPEVSDIRDAVDATVSAIKALSNATLIRRLAWPVCVAASLAESRHDAFFDHLEQGAKGDRDYCTNVLRALEIAQETKRLRRNSPSRAATFDWVDAMESLGHEWVLL